MSALVVIAVAVGWLVAGVAFTRLVVARDYGGLGDTEPGDPDGMFILGLLALLWPAVLLLGIGFALVVTIGAAGVRGGRRG